MKVAGSFPLHFIYLFFFFGIVSAYTAAGKMNLIMVTVVSNECGSWQKVKVIFYEGFHNYFPIHWCTGSQFYVVYDLKQCSCFILG